MFHRVRIDCVIEDRNVRQIFINVSEHFYTHFRLGNRAAIKNEKNTQTRARSEAEIAPWTSKFTQTVSHRFDESWKKCPGFLLMARV